MDLISWRRKFRLDCYHLREVRGAGVGLLIEELILKSGGLATSSRTAKSRPWLSLRVEKCLHSQRDISMVRKKNSGRIKIVPMKAYESDGCQSCIIE